jgi:hypothetical protein
MKNTLLITIAAGGLLVGCGGEPAAPETAPTPTSEVQSVDITQPVAPPATAAPEVTQTEATPITLSESDPLGGKGRPLTEEEVMLINYGVTMFHDEKGRYPANLQEAVATRYILRLPQLPAGEKFVYDSQTGSVKVENTN